jgi:hypothetical protein
LTVICTSSHLGASGGRFHVVRSTLLPPTASYHVSTDRPSRRHLLLCLSARHPRARREKTRPQRTRGLPGSPYKRFRRPRPTLWPAPIPASLPCLPLVSFSREDVKRRSLLVDSLIRQSSSLRWLAWLLQACRQPPGNSSGPELPKIVVIRRAS